MARTPSFPAAPSLDVPPIIAARTGRGKRAVTNVGKPGRSPDAQVARKGPADWPIAGRLLCFVDFSALLGRVPIHATLRLPIFDRPDARRAEESKWTRGGSSVCLEGRDGYNPADADTPPTRRAWG